jgi:hypothetical protein
VVLTNDGEAMATLRPMPQKLFHSNSFLFIRKNPVEESILENFVGIQFNSKVYLAAKINDVSREALLKGKGSVRLISLC